ncbi:hypothetical protein [Comamonas testosteroni]|uniref:hypothetical protein n=1 Tax=Comamonas testosteroni TaxID=285 RepID=UPI003918CDA6
MKNVFFAFIFSLIEAFANASPTSARLMNEQNIAQEFIDEGVCEQPGYEYFQLLKLKERHDGKYDYIVRSKANSYAGVVDMHNARDTIARQLRGKDTGMVFCFILE